MRFIIALIMLVLSPWYLCSGEVSPTIHFATTPITRTVQIPLVYYYDVAIAAYENDIPLWIADNLFRAESGYRNIRGRCANQDGSCDVGIAQLNSNNLKLFSKIYNNGKPVDPYDTKISAKIAMRYLSDLRKATGSLYGGVCAYNCGLSRVLKDSIPERTKKYVQRILGGTNGL